MLYTDGSMGEMVFDNSRELFGFTFASLNTAKEVLHLSYKPNAAQRGLQIDSAFTRRVVELNR
jgi:hypothetical protein